MAHRVGKTMHTGGDTGEIVDSFVIDGEVAAAFGVNFGCEGWMVGYKVKDDAVWKRVNRASCAHSASVVKASEPR
jgi:hypothetical protein